MNKEQIKQIAQSCPKYDIQWDAVYVFPCMHQFYLGCDGECKYIKEYVLEYRGFWSPVNNKPEGDPWIKIWVSDWNKEHFGFYYYVNCRYAETSLKRVLDLIDRLNKRDGDIYVELIDHAPSIETHYMNLIDEASWYLLGQYKKWLIICA